jgi:hypothetical protein
VRSNREASNATPPHTPKVNSESRNFSACEGCPRHPLVSIDATSSLERKCRNRAGVRQVRIAMKGGIFYNQETFDERSQGWAGNLLKNLAHSTRSFGRWRNRSLCSDMKRSSRAMACGLSLFGSPLVGNLKRNP